MTTATNPAQDKTSELIRCNDVLSTAMLQLAGQLNLLLYFFNDQFNQDKCAETFSNALWATLEIAERALLNANDSGEQKKEAA